MVDKTISFHFQTLFTYPGNFRAEKIMSVAKMSDSNVKVDDKFVFGETNKSEAFLKKFPLGKVPIPISYPLKMYAVLLLPFEAAQSGD